MRNHLRRPAAYLSNMEAAEHNREKDMEWTAGSFLLWILAIAAGMLAFIALFNAVGLI